MFLKSNRAWSGRMNMAVGWIILIGMSVLAGCGLVSQPTEVVEYISFTDTVLPSPTNTTLPSLTPTQPPTATELQQSYTALMTPGVGTTNQPAMEPSEGRYVDAGRALGYSDRRIMLRHILPNLVAAVVVQSTIDLAYAILDIAALSFLGLGQQPPDPDWGSMLADARSYLLQAPWPALSAGFAIMLAVISVNLVGDGLRAQLDPRERER